MSSSPLRALLAAAAVVLAVSSCEGHAGHQGNTEAGHGGHHQPKSNEHGKGGHGMGGHGNASSSRGLSATEDGFTLAPSATTLAVGKQTIRFQIRDAHGKAVTSYAEDQTKLLHFYLVRADLTGYVHDHPVLGADGTWSIGVTVAGPGPYRMYADFIAKDDAGKEHPLVLSVPLLAAGGYRPVAVPPVTKTQTVDGLTVATTGTTTRASTLTFTVSDAGEPVTDLEQYLDSFAHLTAVHAGDLAYQHVHPDLTARSGEKGGPDLPFHLSLPESGTWRLFLQIQRGGTLHLVTFTVRV